MNGEESRLNYRIIAFLFLLLLSSCSENLDNKLGLNETDINDIHYMTITVPLYAILREGKYEAIGVESYIYYEDIDAFIDLDSGLKFNDERADIYYLYGCGSMCFDVVHIFEGTKSKRVGSQLLGYEGCYQTIFEEDVNSQRMGTQVGDVTCFITDEGRISQVRVDSSKQTGRDTEMIITITTWEPIVISDFPTD